MKTRAAIATCIVTSTLLGVLPGKLLAGEPDPGITQVNGKLFLDQGWSAAERHEFYFTDQGSHLMPYSWLQHLERAGSREPFLDPAEGLERFGYLNDPSKTKDRNPDGLPIGFTKDNKTKGGQDCDFVGMSCAACHTSLFRHEDKSGKVHDVIVDGAPTGADMYEFVVALSQALDETAANDEKFEAFRAKLPEKAKTPPCETDLRQALRDRSKALTELFEPSGVPKSSPWGPGRLDAVGVIINNIFSNLDQPEKIGPVNAPVSYPFLWDIHQHNQVQWNGVSDLPLIRNTVEVMGVFAVYGPEEHGWWIFKKYDSTVRFDGLKTLENRVETLRSPRWPERLFDDPIDPTLRAEGKKLFEIACRRCHADVPRDAAVPDIRAVMAPLHEIGTDPAMAANFASAPYDKNDDDWPNACAKGPLEDPAMEVLLGKVTPKVLGGAFRTLRLTLSEVARKYLTLPGVDRNRCAYKGRPLDGIWATAPYLHNGSVPNLDELLKPPCERVKKFCVGKVRKFDPVRVGIPSSDNVVVCGDGETLIDTTLPGNSNLGHHYTIGGREFTEPQRRALIEYQKSL